MSANSFFRRLMTKALRARPPVTIQKAKKSARLRVEAFEDRITPTNLTFGLFDTARDSSNNPLPGGAVDSHYTVPVNPNGGTTAYSNGGTGVTPTATPGGLAVPGNYTYRTTFDLRGLNPSTTTLTLTGFYSSDDNTQSFALNGNTFLSPNNNGGSISTSTGFVAGVNTLDVVVNNQNIGNNPTTLDLLGLDISVTGNITYDGTVGNDLITVTATGPSSGTITDATRGVTISFAAATGLTINGLAGNDVLTVNYAGGNLGSVPITFNGGGQAGIPGDTLNVTGGSFASGVYTPTGPNSGTITHVGGTTGTAGLITFTGLEPVTDTTAAANFTINATAGADAINVVNGAVLNGFQTIQVNSGAVPTFELMNFANKTNVTIDATQGGADAVLVNYTTNAAGLASLTVNTGALADTVNVTGTVAAVVTNVNAGGGLDTVNVGNTGAVGTPGLLTPVAGTVIVDGQGGGANLTVDGSGAAVAADYQVTNINVVRVAPAGFGGVQYANLTTLLLTVGGGNNVISVPTTSVPTTINTNAGVDTINVGRNAVGGTNTLAAILGPVTVNGGGQAGDAVNLFDQTSGAGQTYGITATQVTRSGAQPVTYSGVTALGLTATNFADTLNVQSTAAGVTTAVNLAGGSDTANVSSDAPTNAGNLDAIDGPLTLDAGPAADTDVLNISEDGGGADTVLVNLNPGNTISGTAGGGWTITRGPGLFDSINLTNSANVDTVNVRGTAAGEALNIEGNGGYDTVNVGSLAPTTTGGVVANIAGPVSVSNNPSLTHVVIDDSGDATARTITVNANQVTVGAATVNIDPPDLYDLVVNAGQGNDTIDVNSTRDATTVNGGGGQDTFNLNGPGFANFSTNNFNGGDEAGSTGDTFNYTPITNAQAGNGVVVNINGNNPVAGTSPGDTLNVNANGNGVTITPTSVAVNGSPPINFSTIQNIETFLFVNAGPVTVNGDAANNVLTVTSINPATNRATVRLDTPPVTGPVITLDGITQLTFNAAAGNDRMDVDQNGQLFNFPMTYFGGTQTGTPGDTLRVINYNLPNGTVTVTHNPNNAGGHNGTVQVGAGQPTISFNELEPLALSGTAANLIVNLPAATAADNVLLANDGPVNFPGATGDAADDLNTSAIGDNGAVPGFEFTQFTNPTASLTVNMGANNYRMRVRAMDALFAAQINVNGQANSADTLGIDYAGGVVNETINFNGGGGTGNNLLTLVSVASAPIGGPFPNLRETVFGNGNDAGVWYVDPNGTAGPGAPPALFNGDETTLNFQNTQVLESTITAAAIDYVLSPADNVGTLLGDVIPVEGSVNAGAVGVVPGVTPADRLRDDNGSFADLRFVNAGVVRIMGSSGNDAFRLATAAAAPAGLTKLEVYGHVAPDINPAAPLPPDDNGSDVVDFIATHATAGTAGAPAFVVNAFGQGGSDLFTNTGSGAAYGPLPAGLTAANVNNMRLIRGTVTIDGGEQTDAVVDADEIAFEDFNNTATAVTALLTSNKLTGAAPAIINYTAPTIETFYYGASALDDTIDITSTNGDGTAAGTTTYLVSGNGGGDVLTVGNTRANFEAPTFNGDLTAIRGPLQIAGDRTGGTGTNTLNVDASGQATAITNGVIDTVAGQPFPLTPFFGNFVEQGQSTNLTGFAPAQIGYYHNAITSNAGNRFATVNVRTTPLADTITVFATTATDRTTIDLREGDDTMFVNGDGLSANNTFLGFDGNDDLYMNVFQDVGANPGNGNGGFAIQSVLFDGQNNLAGTAGTTANRDRLTINDYNNSARSLNFQYLASQGGVDVLGGGNGLMGGAGTDAVNVRATETLVFNDVFGFNNDNTTLTGTAGDDVLTVAQLPGAANVFLGGAPYTSTPPVPLINPANRPGLSGGGTGTDMYIGGISTSPFPGLRVTGGGFAAAGDQLVVYAASELALNDPASAADAAAADTLLFQTAINPLAFAAGDLVPAFGAFNAYDQIDVSDARVITFNNAFGLLTTVNVDTLSFVQAPPATSAQRPALVVNGGDEAAPQLGTGVADLFFANISPFFNIVVNGNLPLPPNPTPQPPFPNAPLPPNGDALILNVNGSANVYSDASNPPNVSVTQSLTPTPFGVTFSSMERTLIRPTNGIVNLIGDNNNAATPAQDDVFNVVGQDTDFWTTVFNPPVGFVAPFVPNADADGANEFALTIGGNRSGGDPFVSSPIFFTGVSRINAIGGEAVQVPVPGAPAGTLANGYDANGNIVASTATATGADLLNLTPWAANTPSGWGIETYFNGGDDAGTAAAAAGTLADLLTVNGASGVSENVVVQPSGPQSGQVTVSNAAFGTPIASINYVNNTALVVNASSPAGTAGDTDTLTLRGTSPGGTGASGMDTVVVDLTRDGTANNDKVLVRDTATGATLYAVQNFTNFGTLNVQTLGGDDAVRVTGAVAGNVAVTVDAGAGTDSVSFLGTAGQTDTYQVRTGADGTTTVNAAAFGSAFTTATLTGAETVAVDGGGGAGSDSLTVVTPGGTNAFGVTPTSSTSGTVTVNGGPALQFVNLGADSSTVALTNDPVGGTTAGTVSFTGTGGADTYQFTPQGTTAANLQLDPAGNGVTYRLTNVSTVSLDAAAGFDALNVAAGGGNAIITPGSVPGSGTVTPFASAGNGGGQLLGLTYKNVENAAVVQGTVIEVQGSDQDDTITLDANGILTIQNAFGLFNRVDVSAFGTVVVNGLGGNDDITVNPRANTTVQVVGGGNGAAGDALTVVGTGGNLTADLGTATVTEGSGTVTYAGVEDVELNANGGGLAVVGTAGNDTVTVTPNSATAGAFTADTVPNTTFSYTNVAGPFSVAGGAGGFDVLAVRGTGGADTVTGTATSLTVAGGTVNFDGTIDQVNVSTGGGNDTITLGAGMTQPALVDAGDGNDTVTATGVTGSVTLVGGLGNDTLTGGSGADRLDGGDGNDRLVGGPGADSMLGGTGSDTLVWNPGDGSDLVEGGDGLDVMEFNGSAGNEAFSATAVGTRVRFTRDVGGVTMDVGGVEQVNLNTVGGTDTLNVGDLTGTDLRVLNASLGATTAVTVAGTEGADTLTVSSTGAGQVSVTGGAAAVNLTGAVLGADTLVVNAGGGNDTVAVTTAADATIGITANGGAGADTLDLSGLATGRTINLATGAVTGLTGTSGFENVVGTTGTDTVVGADVASTFTLTGPGAVTVTSANGTTTLTRVENLTGGTAGDTFVVQPGASLAGTVDAGAGSDTVAGTAGDDAINVTGVNAATVGGVTFANAENLSAGGGNDRIAFANGASVAGTVDAGAGTDTLDFSASAAPVTLNLQANTVTVNGVTTSLAGVESVIGSGAAGDTIVGSDVNPNTFNVTGVNAGDVGGVTFSGFENLTGGARDDNFVFASGASVSGAINGGAGFDTLTQTGNDGPNVVVANAAGVTLDGVAIQVPAGSSIEGVAVRTLGGADTVTVSAGSLLTAVDTGAGNDVITLANGVTLDVTGGTGSDTVNVAGTAGADTVTVTQGTDPLAGTVTGTGGTVTYAGVETLGVDGAGGVNTLAITGTGGNDVFSVTGTAGAGAGTAAVNSGTTVSFTNLGTGATLNLSGLGGDDNFGITQPANWGVTAVNIDGGPAPFTDTASVTGTAAADAFVWTPSTGLLTVTPAGGTTTTYAMTNLQTVGIDGAAPTTAPGDTLFVPERNPFVVPSVIPVNGGPAVAGPANLVYKNIESVRINNVPAAVNDDALTTPEDAAATFNVLANDTGTTDGNLTLAIVQQPASGTLTVQNNGTAGPTVRYTPTANFFGTDTFTYTVTDENGEVSNVATATVTVTPVNDAPVAVNDAYTTPKNVPLTVAAPGVLANDTDVDTTAAQLSAVVVAQPTNGTLVLNANGSFTYTPSANFAGTDTFTYRVNDGGAANNLSNVATVTLTVSGLGGVGPGGPGVTVAAGSDAGTFINGAPAPARVRTFDANGNVLTTLTPFGGFTGGVRVATGDFNQDGVQDVAYGTGPGVVARVQVVDGKTGATLFDVQPFESTFTGGVFLTAGDVNKDGRADLVVSPDVTGGPRVRVFNGNGFTVLADFLGITDPNFRGGARVAVGDMNGDGYGDVVVAAGFGGGPRVAFWDGKAMTNNTLTKQFNDIFVFEQSLRNGVYIAAADMDGDGFGDLVVGGGPGGAPRLQILSGNELKNGVEKLIANFFAGDPEQRGGLRVAVTNLDNDQRADLIVGSGSGPHSTVTGYLGKDFPVRGPAPERYSVDAFPEFEGGVYVG